MPSSKPQNRLFTDPRHLIWIKYFEKQGKTPVLPKGAPAGLVTIFQQIIQPTVPKTKIYEPPSTLNADNEEFLLDLFDLKTPLSPSEIILIKYIKQNPQYLSKPFKVLNVIGSTIVRSIIKFLIQLDLALHQENPDDLSLLFTLEDAEDIYWVMLHMPKPYKSDIKICLSSIYNILPYPDNKFDKIFDSQYIRDFECKALGESAPIIDYNKAASPFYFSLIKFLISYVSCFISKMGEQQFSGLELANMTLFLISISQASPEFVLSIQPETFQLLIDSIFIMVSKIQNSFNTNTNNELIFMLCYRAFNVVNHLLTIKKEYIEYTCQNENFKNFFLFQVWCFITFQNVKDIPFPAIPFEKEVTEDKKIMNIELVERKPYMTPHYGEEITNLQELQPTKLEIIHQKVLQSLDLLNNLLRLIGNRKIADNMAEQMTNIAKNIINGEDLWNGFEKSGKYSLIYAFFVFAHINNAQIFPFTHLLRDLFDISYIYDYNIEEMTDEEHNVRYYTRQEILNSFLKNYERGSRYSSDILAMCCKYMIGSHLHICDELLMFLYTVFNRQPKDFIETINYQELVKALVWYEMALQSSPYPVQRNKFISFLTILLRNETICNNVLKIDQMTSFLFHCIFDVELHGYYAQLIRDSLKLVTKEDCFASFCKIFHQFLSGIVTKTDGKLNILTELFSQLDGVFELQKNNLQKFIVQNNIISDISSILKILKVDGYHCALKMLRVLILIVMDEPQNREKLNRYNEDFYDAQLAFYNTDNQNIPALIDVLLYFVFEKQTFITGELNSYFIKNPESLIMLHNATYDKPSHAGLLAFIHCIIDYCWTNNAMISNSHFTDILINFYRQITDINSQSSTIIEKILITQFSWDFKPRYFLQLFSPHESKEYFMKVMKLMVEGVNSIPTGFTNFITLTGLKTMININNVKIKSDSKGFSFCLCFRIDRQINKHTICSITSDTGDCISIFINSLTLHYMSTNGNTIKTNKTMTTKKWYNLVVNISGFDFMISIDGENVTTAWESFKLGKESTVKITIGALSHYLAPAQISVSSFHMFKAPLSIEQTNSLSKIDPQEMQTKKDLNDLIILLTPFHRRSNYLINQIESKFVKAEFNGKIVSFQNIHTAILHTNGIIRLLKLCSNSNELTFVLKIMRMLMATNPDFIKNLFKVMNVEVFGSFISNKIDSKLFTLESARELEAIWELIKDEEIRNQYFRHILFNFKLWMSMDLSIIKTLFETTHIQIMHDFIHLTANILSCQYLFNYIVLCDNVILRNLLWKILFEYLSISCSKDDKQAIISFSKNAPEKLSLELLLRLFGIINLNSETSKILWKLTSEMLTSLLFRLIYLLEDDKTRADAASFITKESWLELSKAFLSLLHNSIFFSVLIVTSQFHDSQLLNDFFSQINKISEENPLIIAMLMEAPFPQIWFFYSLFRTNERVIDFTIANNLQVLVAKIISVSLTFKHMRFETILYSIYMLGLDKRVDVVPFIRNILLLTIKYSTKPSKIDIVRFTTMIFTFIHCLPKSDIFTQNSELMKLFGLSGGFILPTKVPNVAVKYTDFVNLFNKEIFRELFPLTLGMRVDSKGFYLDIDLSVSFLNYMKNFSQEEMEQKIFNSLKISSIVTYVFSNVSRVDPNRVGDLMILFEKIFPPDICHINCFSSFSYSLYNSVTFLTYWQGTFGKFVQKYCKLFGSFERHLLSDESSIFNDKNLNHFFVENFGERMMYNNELIERFVSHISFEEEENLISNKNSLNEFIQSNQKKLNVDLVFANSFKEISFSEISVQKMIVEISKINTFDNEQTPVIIEKLDKPKAQKLDNYVWFDNHFHPVLSTTFKIDLVEINKWPLGNQFPNDFSFFSDNFLVAKCQCFCQQRKYNCLFYLDKTRLIVGGLQIIFGSIFSCIIRSDKSFEVYLKDGKMLLIVFEDLQVSILEKIISDLFKDPIFVDPISVFDYVLWENFLNGKSFNLFDNQPIFPEVTEQGKISDKILSAFDFTFQQTLDKWNNLKSLELQSSGNSVIEWTERTLGKKLRHVTFSDDSQQSNVFISSLVFKDKVKFNNEVSFVNSDYGLTEKGQIYKFIDSDKSDSVLVRVLPVKGICCSQIYLDKIICSGDYFDSLFIGDCNSSERDEFIFTSQVKSITSIDYERFVILSNTESVISIFGDETPAIFKDHEFYPLNISRMRINSIDSSSSSGLICSLDSFGKVVLSSMNDMSTLKSFLISHKYTNIYLFDIGILVATSPTEGISSFSFDGTQLSHIDSNVPVGSASKIEIDGHSSFIAAPFDDQLTIIDARTLRIAKVLPDKRKMLESIYCPHSKSLICTMEGDVALSASV
ncbi:hypothetical protein TVAG_250710 [Trichomonas vaginalis G3]|uniref:Beige/BEACH domain containing protein n=1 Tax=Trichomonas vaginalis (strain ATCC PRA-98 / G3) TaxID=412133 RepID=A2ESS0_TRIV3|nr:concanavalin A-like lectin/glucanases superfamily [Trichomonas vaginalis G3]EAY04311.1 hypothetical protein TVAG_250710 [Trichomonas vaginalis G3]KAI5498274.1 concanavalin A-like lectin/glucanases superfamily [Trichomonas vaginalis G3]|eukprot:XP_001316534.1 hypothetical protein [Trichomonas vaginalis G3]